MKIQNDWLWSPDKSLGQQSSICKVANFSGTVLSTPGHLSNMNQPFIEKSFLEAFYGGQQINWLEQKCWLCELAKSLFMSFNIRILKELFAQPCLIIWKKFEMFDFILWNARDSPSPAKNHRQAVKYSMRPCSFTFVLAGHKVWQLQVWWNQGFMPGIQGKGPSLLNPFLPECKTTFSLIFFYDIFKLLRPEHNCYAKFTSCST